MKKTALRVFPFVAILAAFYILGGSPLIAQNKADAKQKDKGFCSWNNYGNGDNVSFKETRELAVASTGSLSVDGGKNGGVSVKGENRSDILVRACVSAWGSTEAEAKSIVDSVKIITGGTVKADGPENRDHSNWSVSFEVLVPRNTNLEIRATNGGIGISSVEGNISFETSNGGVNLSDLAGDVRGRTTNGGLNVSLTGNTWKGSGLDVTTTNGGVNLSVPENYSANFEAGTTNGGFKSNVPSLEVTEENNVGKTDNWSRSKRVRATMNGGGANIRVVTTNGGIKIGSTSYE